MAKKIKKRWILLMVMAVMVIFFIEKRSFYCLDNGNCVTVWKNIGGTCYVMPYKYYGLFHPADNYIKTTNLSSIEIFWSDNLPNEVIFGISSESDLKQVVNNSKEIVLSNMYISEEEYGAALRHGKNITKLKNQYRDILYDQSAKLASEVKDSVSYIWIDIASDRLIDKKDS